MASIYHPEYAMQNWYEQSFTYFSNRNAKLTFLQAPVSPDDRHWYHWHSHPTQFDHVLPFDPYYYRLDQHRRKFTISAALSTNQYD
jgi:hypothetical protein